MSAPAIRETRPPDRPGILALIHALNLYEAALSADRRTDAAAEECLAAIEDRIARDGGAVLVACEGETVLGVLSLTFATDEPFVRPELRHYGLVTDLVVAGTHRGRGIGGMLLREAESRARDAGCARLMIGVLASNEEARAAYERCGFAPHMLLMGKTI